MPPVRPDNLINISFSLVFQPLKVGRKFLLELHMRVLSFCQNVQPYEMCVRLGSYPVRPRRASTVAQITRMKRSQRSDRKLKEVWCVVSESQPCQYFDRHNTQSCACLLFSLVFYVVLCGLWAQLWFLSSNGAAQLNVWKMRSVQNESTPASPSRAAGRLSCLSSRFPLVLSAQWFLSRASFRDWYWLWEISGLPFQFKTENIPTGLKEQMLHSKSFSRYRWWMSWEAGSSEIESSVSFVFGGTGRRMGMRHEFSCRLCPLKEALTSVSILGLPGGL